MCLCVSLTMLEGIKEKHHQLYVLGGKHLGLQWGANIRSC